MSESRETRPFIASTMCNLAREAGLSAPLLFPHRITGTSYFYPLYILSTAFFSPALDAKIFPGSIRVFVASLRKDEAGEEEKKWRKKKERERRIKNIEGAEVRRKIKE